MHDLDSLITSQSLHVSCPMRSGCIEENIHLMKVLAGYLPYIDLNGTENKKYRQISTPTRMR